MLQSVYWEAFLRFLYRNITLKSSVFWDIIPCSQFNVNRRFEGTCRSACWFLAWLIPRPRRWRRHVPTKRRLIFNGRYISEYRSLHNHRCENLKSYMLHLVPAKTFSLWFPFLLTDTFILLRCGRSWDISIPYFPNINTLAMTLQLEFSYATQSVHISFLQKKEPCIIFDLV
jgi:hypothetical protein